MGQSIEINLVGWYINAVFPSGYVTEPLFLVLNFGMYPNNGSGVHTKIQGHQDDVGDIGINIDTTGVYTGVRP